MMEILRVEGTDDSWDEFVWQSSGGTLFHTLNFLSYHPPSRFDFTHLAVREGGELACVIPGGRVKAGQGDVFRSPVGASFGGFVFKDDMDLAAMWEIIREASRRIETMGFDGIEMVLPPICYSRGQHQSLGFLLISAGYRPASSEATFVVHLDSFDQNRLHPVLQRNLRKAEKSGLDIHTTTGLNDFYDVLVRNLALKGTSPTHTLEELERLFDLFPDRLILVEAVFERSVVGGCLLILCNDRVGLSFYICDDPDKRDLRISEAVLYTATRLLKERGYTYLDLGTISKGGQINWGLVRFKSKFAPRTYVRERYALKFGERQG